LQQLIFSRQQHRVAWLGYQCKHRHYSILHGGTVAGMTGSNEQLRVALEERLVVATSHGG